MTADRRARFDGLYRAHRAAVQRVALRYGGGRKAFADDVVQETFLKAWQHLDELRDDDPGGWLYVVATRVALSRLRQEAVRRNPLVAFFAPAPSTPPGADAERVVELASDAKAAVSTLSRLPPQQRVAFWMTHVDEKPLQAIADVLGCSVSYASRLVSRAEAAVKNDVDVAAVRAARRPLAD